MGRRSRMDVDAKSCHFFEGVEKLLEIWFAGNNSSASLRNVPRFIWKKLLESVKCEIISCSSNDSIDAYVLSESSMFISQRRWILKTCGTTIPLHCLLPLLNIAFQMGFTEVSDVFYSRKNFSRPELQVYPHQSFCEEVEVLDSIFKDGRSYCLGSINCDCWYLYTFSKQCTIENSIIQKKPEVILNLNQTLEILMENLDENTMATFSKGRCFSARDATVASGINTLLPEMVIDDFLFDPCGYSMNGIGKNGQYMTIHITPEKEFSYVSFESNAELDSYAELINRVIRTFKPSKFIVTIFANQTFEAYATIKVFEQTNCWQWIRTNLQCCSFPAYNLLFAQYMLQ